MFRIGYGHGDGNGHHRAQPNQPNYLDTMLWIKNFNGIEPKWPLIKLANVLKEQIGIEGVLFE